MYFTIAKYANSSHGVLQHSQKYWCTLYKVSKCICDAVSTHRISQGWGIRVPFLPVSRLIPRPSHCPVFDCLQYAKTEREGLHDVSVYLGRQMVGGAPNHKNAFRTHILCFEPRVVEFFTSW